MSRPKRSIYTPTNSHKYLGKNEIICRSSWERKFCVFLDNNSNVEKWASEEIEIPYVSPKDGKIHRYYPDFYIRMKNGKSSVIEVKPDKETKKPNPPKKNSPKIRERFMNESITFSVNQSKWIHAKNWCETRNLEFLVYTEKHLRALGIRI